MSSLKNKNILVKLLLNKNTIILIAVFLFNNIYSQIDSSIILSFDFNDHQIKEKNNKVVSRYIGVSLVEDRFGNEKSAIYLHGHNASYLNLGTSDLLKPKAGTISLWVKMERKVYTGKGYESNPIITTKNLNKYDFYDAYVLFYDWKSDRLMVFSSKDSTEQAGVNSLETMVFNKWYHLLFTYDDTHLAFYINGQLQLKTRKGFATVFDKKDSVVVGNGASTNNARYMRGTVDDIQIFHKVLNEEEIKKIYEAPNPNKFRKTIAELGKYFVIGLFFLVLLFVIIFMNKRKLKRQKEQ